jgi:hypothetical protein
MSHLKKMFAQSGPLLCKIKYHKAYFKVNFLIICFINNCYSSNNERHRKPLDDQISKNIFVRLMLVYKKFNKNKIK